MRIPTLAGLVRTLGLSSTLQKTLGGEIPYEQLGNPLSLDADIPGGSPLGFCDVSGSTDLFQISSVEITKQPVYMFVNSAQ